MKAIKKFCKDHPGMKVSVTYGESDNWNLSMSEDNRQGVLFVKRYGRKEGVPRGKKLLKQLERMAKSIETSKTAVLARKEEGEKPMTEGCAKCGADISTADRGEVQFIERYEDKSRKLVGKVLLCKDCLSKAQQEVSDWTELPYWL